MTLEELANVIGVTPQYLSLIERNKRANVSQEVVKKIADYFHVHISFLYSDGPVPLDKFIDQFPNDLKEFILNKEKRPYLELAKNFAESDLSPEVIQALIEAMKKR